jgi:hypothetical protein
MAGEDERRPDPRGARAGTPVAVGDPDVYGVADFRDADAGWQRVTMRGKGFRRA